MKRATTIIAAGAIVMALGACTDVNMVWNADDGAMTVTAQAPTLFSSTESVAQTANEAASEAQEALNCTLHPPKVQKFRPGDIAKAAKVILEVVGGMPKNVVTVHGICIPNISN